MSVLYPPLGEELPEAWAGILPEGSSLRIPLCVGHSLALDEEGKEERMDACLLDGREKGRKWEEGRERGGGKIIDDVWMKGREIG